MIDDFDFYVGIDWPSREAPGVCRKSHRGKVIGELAFEHSGAGLIDFIHSLKLNGSLATRVGIVLETPRGPVVECVLERGYSVFSINPKQLDRFRDRHTVAGAKDASK